MAHDGVLNHLARTRCIVLFAFDGVRLKVKAFLGNLKLREKTDEKRKLILRKSKSKKGNSFLQSSTFKICFAGIRTHCLRRIFIFVQGTVCRATLSLLYFTSVGGRLNDNAFLKT